MVKIQWLEEQVRTAEEDSDEMCVACVLVVELTDECTSFAAGGGLSNQKQCMTPWLHLYTNWRLPQRHATEKLAIECRPCNA